MNRYIRNRILTGLITIIFSFCLTFFIIRFAPGNPIRVLAGTDNPNPDMVMHLTEKYGLNDPIHIQFVNYLKNLMKGDFGFSYVKNKPVLEILKAKIVPTIALTLTASILSLLIGTSLGLVSGRKAGSKLDKFLCVLSYVIDALPSFWLGLILILIFSTKFKILPTSGMYDMRQDYQDFQKFLDLARHMILPIMTLVIIQVPVYFRIARSSILQTLNEDFITTFRATGMSEKKIFNKYVLRNALIPIITTFSMSMAFLIAGVSLIEIVFAWPGMGRVIMDAIKGRDYPVLTGIYLLISISITFFMIVTDIVYALVDPRIRFE